MLYESETRRMQIRSHAHEIIFENDNIMNEEILAIIIIYNTIATQYPRPNYNCVSENATRRHTAIF